jgi:dephospho-CoA kinase
MATTVPEISTFVVGVTGGIGSGKTTVSSVFADRYAVPVIDADLVAREVVEPGQPGLAELVESFGTGVLDQDGKLDRRQLKGIVFSDPDKRKRLEAILHPKIRQLTAIHLAHINAPYCLLCIPLLAEGGRHELIRRVLVVDCPELVQLRRVTSRDQLSEQQVRAIMATQASREERLAIADDVVVNDGDSDSLNAAVEKLHALYSTLAAESGASTNGP